MQNSTCTSFTRQQQFFTMNMFEPKTEKQTKKKKKSKVIIYYLLLDENKL